MLKNYYLTFRDKLLKSYALEKLIYKFTSFLILKKKLKNQYLILLK